MYFRYYPRYISTYTRSIFEDHGSSACGRLRRRRRRRRRRSSSLLLPLLLLLLLPLLTSFLCCWCFRRGNNDCRGSSWLLYVAVCHHRVIIVALQPLALLCTGMDGGLVRQSVPARHGAVELRNMACELKILASVFSTKTCSNSGSAKMKREIKLLAASVFVYTFLTWFARSFQRELEFNATKTSNVPKVVSLRSNVVEYACVALSAISSIAVAFGVDFGSLKARQLLHLSQLVGGAAVVLASTTESEWVLILVKLCSSLVPPVLCGQIALLQVHAPRAADTTQRRRLLARAFALVSVAYSMGMFLGTQVARLILQAVGVYLRGRPSRSVVLVSGCGLCISAALFLLSSPKRKTPEQIALSESVPHERHRRWRNLALIAAQRFLLKFGTQIFGSQRGQVFHHKFRFTTWDTQWVS